MKGWKIAVYFRDADRRVVDKGETIDMESLRPGETKTFQVMRPLDSRVKATDAEAIDVWFETDLLAR